jgi:hypothetical protein
MLNVLAKMSFELPHIIMIIGFGFNLHMDTDCSRDCSGELDAHAPCPSHI